MQNGILIQKNKQVVRDFNMQVIVAGNRDAFDALMRRDFVNRSAPPGAPDGPESMWNTFEHILRPALGNLTVEIHDQIAEGDKVTTRKTISGVHVGPPHEGSRDRKACHHQRHRHRSRGRGAVCGTLGDQRSRIGTGSIE